MVVTKQGMQYNWVYVKTSALLLRGKTNVDDFRFFFYVLRLISDLQLYFKTTTYETKSDQNRTERADRLVSLPLLWRDRNTFPIDANTTKSATLFKEDVENSFLYGEETLYRRTLASPQKNKTQK